LETGLPIRAAWVNRGCSTDRSLWTSLTPAGGALQPSGRRLSMSAFRTGPVSLAALLGKQDWDLADAPLFASVSGWASAFCHPRRSPGP
jgi:hypothetical protein